MKIIIPATLQTVESKVKSSQETQAKKIADIEIISSLTTHENCLNELREKVKNMALKTFEAWESQSIMTELEPPAIGRLDEIQAPTLAVVGDLDMPGIKEIVDLVIAKVPGAKKVVIPGVAHMVNMEKPDVFNIAVLEFLDKLDL